MEFHAVILCGKGQALSPFSQVRSTGTPKALLPIANRPMIEYVLEWCEKAFFPNVTIVSDEESKDDIETAVGKYKARKRDKESEFNINIETIGMNVESSGTLLVKICKYLGINKHFALLPCDFITDLPPQVLIEAYRSRSDTDLGLIVDYKNQLDIEDKKNVIFPINYTIYSHNNDGNLQLLDLYSSEDVEFHKSLPIRTQMTWRYANSIVSTKLLNSAIFFGSTDILNILETNSNKFTDSYINNRSFIKIIRDLARRSWKHSRNLQTIGFLIIPHQATFIRSNNTTTFLEANRYFMKVQALKKVQNQQQQPIQQQQTKEKGAANIGIDSLVGDKTTLGEKTNVKRTIIGENCIIGKRVKLTGCLILNNVSIEDDVQLENCIIGHDVIIHSKSKLTNTNVESTHEVARGTMAKSETLLCLSLEGIVHDDDDDEEDSDDNSSDSDSDSDTDEYDDEYADNDDGLFDY